jgi:hypothetical protein
MAGRQLNPNQLESLAAKAKLFAGEQAIFSVNVNDVEAAMFASQLAGALKRKEVGWQATVGILLHMGSIRPGIIVNSTTDEKSQHAATMLVEELCAAGLLVSLSPLDPDRKGMVWIEVGPKPLPTLGPEG